MGVAGYYKVPPEEPTGRGCRRVDGHDAAADTVAVSVWRVLTGFHFDGSPTFAQPLAPRFTSDRIQKPEDLLARRA